MKTKKKVVIGMIITAISLASAIIGLWDRFVPVSTDIEVKLLQKENLIIFSPDTPPVTDKIIKANLITIDGIQLEIKNGGGIVANKIIMTKGGEIHGTDFFLVATTIEGGKISTTGSENLDGGDVLIVTALLDGTVVEANGLNGTNGENGRDGIHGANGANGRDGSCKGFGGWRSADPGRPGTPGGNGEDGKSGQNGGDAGNITILTSYSVTTQPEAIAGEGGRGGKGGAAGQGGKGGRGGSGCTGLGGAQDGRPSGADGPNGIPGKDGPDGQPGKAKVPVVKMIDFGDVKDLLEESLMNESALASKLKMLPSKK